MTISRSSQRILPIWLLRIEWISRFSFFPNSDECKATNERNCLNQLGPHLQFSD